MNIVLDASMALSWHFGRTDVKEDAISRRALIAIDQLGAVVPPLWHLEVANGVLVGERRKIGSHAASTAFLAKLDALHVETDELSYEITRSTAITLARTHQLTVYDAAYLELALRTGAPLATFDRQLAEAARTCGVPVFGENP